MNNVDEILKNFIIMKKGSSYDDYHIDSISWLAKKHGFKKTQKKLCVSYQFKKDKTFKIIYDLCKLLIEDNIPFILINNFKTLIYDGHKFNELDTWIDWNESQKILSSINDYPEYQEKFKLHKIMDLI